MEKVEIKIKLKNYETYYRSARVRFSNKFRTIFDNFVLYWPIFSFYIGLSSFIFDFLLPSPYILVFLVLSRFLLVFLVLSCSLLVFEVISRSILVFLVLSHSISGSLPISGKLWQSLTISGSLWQSRANSELKKAGSTGPCSRNTQGFPQEHTRQETIYKMFG